VPIKRARQTTRVRVDSDSRANSTASAKSRSCVAFGRPCTLDGQFKLGIRRMPDARRVSPPPPRASPSHVPSRGGSTKVSNANKDGRAHFGARAVVQGRGSSVLCGQIIGELLRRFAPAVSAS